MMDYVPLVDVPAPHGEAAVLFACLAAAGFEPITECDLRGWMYWWKLPVGSLGPVTIFVPRAHREDALAYLSAPIESMCTDAAHDTGFWSGIRDSRSVWYTAWAALVFSGFY